VGLRVGELVIRRKEVGLCQLTGGFGIVLRNVGKGKGVRFFCTALVFSSDRAALGNYCRQKKKKLHLTKSI
jgi:hypothetical protein